jgi:hypothetical protein
MGELRCCWPGSLCRGSACAVLLVSPSCALGFASTNRGAMTDSREAQAARLASADADLKDTKAKLKPFATKPLRAAGVI